MSPRRPFNDFFKDIWEKMTRRNRSEGELEHPVSVPWDTWELDPHFFRAMSKWKVKHPESTFECVMENIRVAVEKGEDVTERSTSDTQFPARSLVKALACLLKLGVTISRTKKEAFEFTNQVVAWIKTIEVAFEKGEIGRFASHARKNLKYIRALIDEICKWATDRLIDGRWSQLTHGLRTKSEVEQFNERLIHARDLLVQLDTITLVRAVGGIVVEIRAVKELQHRQLNGLDQSGASPERQQILHNTRSSSAIQKTVCDEDTRVEILADIKAWVNDISEGTQNFFWLTGDPGCGKSTIAASLARYCKDAGNLWAQYSINRNIDTTTNPSAYFPSIARQMVDHSSHPAVTVAVIKGQPSLLDKISIDQALGLFVEVIHVACDIDKTKPVIIIIDGLDETNRDQLEDTAKIFSKLFNALQRPNAKVFISSRIEDKITKHFYTTMDDRHVKHVHLDTSHPSSIEDVSTFLCRRIERLVVDNDLNWEEWPGEQRLKNLCLRASGLFIWAVTVTKFFQDQLELFGHDRLNELLDEMIAEGMDDINVLYETILKITHKPKMRDGNDSCVYETFRRVVGVIIALKEPLTISELGNFIDLRRPPTSSPVDNLQFLRNLKTFLVLSSATITTDTKPFFHKSFVDYLTSQRVPPEFRIDVGTVDGEIVVKCLRFLNGLTFESSQARKQLEKSMRYALQHWPGHLPTRQGSISGFAIINASAEEALKTIGMETTVANSSSAVVATLANDVWLTSGAHHYHTHMYDRKTGLPVQSLSPINGHSSAIWTVAFSPDGRWIASGSGDKTIRLWDSKSGHSICPPLQGHTGAVRSIAFSRNGKWIASGSDDKTVRVWDCLTKQPIGFPLLGHTDKVRSVIFSVNGNRIVSVGHDGNICVWDRATYRLNRLPFKNGRPMLAVALSPDGRRIASGGADKCIWLWDWATQTNSVPFEGHTDSVLSLAFSPDGSRIVSGSLDRTIRIWESDTGQSVCLPPFERLNIGIVKSVTFSPDGLWIVAGGSPTISTMHVWDSKTGEHVRFLGPGHTVVNSVAFSPDGRQIVSGSNDRTIRVWDAHRGEELTRWPRLHSCKITTLAISPVTRIAASSVGDEKVVFWDKKTGSTIGDSIRDDNTHSIISASFSPDGELYAASTLDGRACIWDVTKRALVWKTNASLRGINSLKFYDKRLVVSCPDGSKVWWDLTDGRKPTSVDPIIESSQVQLSKVKNFNFAESGRSCPADKHAVLQWIPFDVDAGLWAYIDGTIIRSDGEESWTVIKDSRLHTIS